ncbi:alpha/beta-hydrolase [Gymnopus androsaceus JB14]|uniref:Alpha/beta-hydrolase n=1 Tax=Gymnopus androsaceus JB14 TaxID=1447944 RepID=A0A6A4HEQ4_9AGAR|nr:alpha/beta-hydrolase [Gymnopus androsaceus JB14]
MQVCYTATRSASGYTAIALRFGKYPVHNLALCVTNREFSELRGKVIVIDQALLRSPPPRLESSFLTTTSYHGLILAYCIHFNTCTFPTNVTEIEQAVISHILSLEALQAPLNAAFAPVIDLGYAKYQGTIDPSTQNWNFLGICYAAEPTGTLCFSAPAPPPSVSGIQKANAYLVRCGFQEGTGMSPVNPFSKDAGGFKHQNSEKSIHADDESEDCLFLNVYTPIVTPGKKEGLPVVVFVHGGGSVAILSRILKPLNHLMPFLSDIA